MGLYAAVDLGSNNFRLLVAEEAAPGVFLERLLLNRIVRAGQGIGAGGEVSPEALARVEGCLAEFGEALDRLGVEKRYAALTAAGRDLRDGGVYADMARCLLKAEVWIPEGTEEAELAFRGAVGMLGGKAGDSTMLDIGGGSTEIAWRQGNETRFESMRLGVVRLTEEASPVYPLGPDGFGALSDRAAEVIAKSGFARAGGGADEGGGLAITAGTALTLAAHLSGRPIADTRALTGVVARSEEIAGFADFLSALDLSEIRALPAIVPGREDVIAAGVAILSAFMELSGFSSCTVSDGGLAEGLLFSRSAGGSGKISYTPKDVV